LLLPMGHLAILTSSPRRTLIPASQPTTDGERGNGGGLGGGVRGSGFAMQLVRIVLLLADKSLSDRTEWRFL
jgi:hypothetical protein